VRRALSFVLILAVLLATGAPAALAGSAAPAAGNRLARLAPDIGDTVAISNPDGDELGTVTLEEIVDPFEEFEERAEPGLRFLSIELTIENTGEDDLEIATGNIGVVDEAGTIFVRVADITRTDDAEPLEDTTLEPGDEITGSLAVGFPEDGEIAQVFWFVDTGILPIIYNAAEPVPPGDTVMLSTEDFENYEDVAELTVDELVDPLEDVEAGSRQRAIGATISIENAGEEPFAPEPASFYLGTTAGIFWSPDPSIERSDDAIDGLPDLTGDEIEPGDQATGFVGFLIPEDAEISYLMYFPGDGTRMVRIFDARTSTGDDSRDEGNLGPIGRDAETPEADETPQDDNGSTGDDCDGAAAWADESIDRLIEWSTALGEIDAGNPDPDALRDAADISAGIAAAQADSTPPPAAEELNDLLTQAYEDTADALNAMADATEEGDDAAYGEAAQVIAEIGTSLQSGEIADVLADAEAVCPELSDL
jgi:hypothetical protein